MKHSPFSSLRLRVVYSAFMAMVLVACGAAPTPPVTPTSTEKTVLHVYTYNQPPMSQVTDIATKAFNAIHPDITVQIDAITGDPVKEIASMVKTNQTADVVWTIDALTPSLVDAGVLLDMSEMANIDSAFKKEDVDPRAIAGGNMQNDPGLYMVPAVMESVQMYFNKTMFKKAGVPLPSADWKWDDLLAACKQIQSALANVSCVGYSNAVQQDPSWWGFMVPWIRGYGGDVLSSDGKLSTLSKPEALAGLQAYIDLWNKYHVAAQTGQRGFCFIAQRCAVMFWISGGLAQYQDRIGKDFEWDAQLMPAFPKGRFTGSAIYGYGIAKTSTHPDLAWEYVKLMASAGVQMSIAKNRAGMPVLKSVLTDPVMNSTSAFPVNMQVFISGAEYGIAPRSYPVACGTFYNGLVQSALSEAYKAALENGKVYDAFKKADATIQNCIDGAQ